MMFRGRLVIALVLLSMFTSSVITLSIVDAPIVDKMKNQDVSGLSAKEVEQLASTTGMSAIQLSKLLKAYELIQQKYYRDVDGKQVMSGAIQGMITALDDPYSSYMDEEAAAQFKDSLESSFQGIGAEVTMRDGKLLIISPIKGSPAEKAGLRPNDQIISVNSETLAGLSLYDAVSKIRGPKGTQAKLEIIRVGENEPIHVNVIREKIAVDTVYSQMLENGIGKIEITQFSEQTSDAFKQHLERLEAKGLKGLIIDVRNDPGGLLPEVINICSQLVEKGKTIVRVEYGDGKQESYPSNGGSKTYPIMVLINGGSASASEILAAALHESSGAKLLGVTSFGKGTVQNTFQQEMGDNSNLKLTIGKWLTPNGTWIHKVGIKPDINVEQPDYFKVSPLSGKTIWQFDQADAEIKNAQIMLKALGFDSGRSDGYFNETTKLAVAAFQAKFKLPITTKLDNATITGLQDQIRTLISDPLNDKQLNRAVQEIQMMKK